MRQGAPQGSVLSPMLFIFYTNNLAKILPDLATTAMFADDVSILGTSESLTVAEEIVQQVVDIVN